MSKNAEDYTLWILKPIDNGHSAPHITKPENNTKERMERLQKPEDRASIRRVLSINVGKA